MKYIPQHTHSIEIEFTNSVNKLLCFRATFPVNKIKHDISKWYRITKEAVASTEKVPVNQINGKHKIIESEMESRILFEWPGGYAINLPDDATDYDYKIVIHYLDGILMALNRPTPPKDNTNNNQ